jgi:hypothetical protein
MKVEFLIGYEARTKTGIRTITVGTVLDLGDDKARPLIGAGIVKKVYEHPSLNPDARPYLDARNSLVIPCDAPPRYRWWQGGQSVEETLRELFEERVAIMEIDGGLTREEAERQAAILTRYVPRGTESSGVA